MNKERFYIAIDLKSFYASVECVERGMDPLNTNLVVADPQRTEKTICLAVSPSLKAYKISGRARLFEVVSRVKEINEERRKKIRGEFSGFSYFADELMENENLGLAYIVAPPRMSHYIEYSTKIYSVYLRYIAPEDMHVYSVDEVFLDVTNYLSIYKMSVKELASMIVKDVYDSTGITATAGIGTNMYLCKVAMDVLAKHAPMDENGVRIAMLDELSYRQQLWNHRPITDFWRVGEGYRKRLEEQGLYTMGDIARCSLGKPDEYYNEELLYKLFGVNAELLIDHAWGYEPVTMDLIKSYRPSTNSLCQGQVLTCPYDFYSTRLVVHEMVDALVLDMVDKRLVTNQLVLTVGYDKENISNKPGTEGFKGETKLDRYGRRIPKHAHGTVNLKQYSSSTEEIVKAVLGLYDDIVDKSLLTRRISISANRLIPEEKLMENVQYQQLDLFTDYKKVEQDKENAKDKLVKERKMQEAMLAVKKKYGKNALLKGFNLEDGATARERNQQIGGHKA